MRMCLLLRLNSQPVSLNKAPDLKGPSAEIYKQFQEILENFLTKNGMSHPHQFYICC